ncbi:MAG TPA: methyltransferase domain-containing protein [Candidatus Binataceae bacterium]|nr:methyltransferase domain-containing protein [Candidatus Binataceae bacterium]
MAAPKSIECAGYIHGTSASEQERLAALNRLTNEQFVEFLDPSSARRILEVGSGLGILAARVAQSAPDAMVVGVEQSSEQLARATASLRVRYVRGDAHRLPFVAGSFDLAYCRYVLEHVRDPAMVLREMYRVLREGAWIVVMENDITAMRYDPPSEAFDEVWRAFAELQRRIGGDGLIGSKLFRMLCGARFRDVELSIQPEVHWAGSSGFEAWIENQIGNLRGAYDALIESRLASHARIDEAIADLDALRMREDASAIFYWNRATGRK